MMLYPSINEDLKDKTDNRYTLVMLAAKRARDIIAGKPVLTEVDDVRPVSLATNEISEGLISYRRLTDEEMALLQDENTKATAIAEAVEQVEPEIVEAAPEQVEPEQVEPETVTAE